MTTNTPPEPTGRGKKWWAKLTKEERELHTDWRFEADHRNNQIMAELGLSVGTVAGQKRRWNVRKKQKERELKSAYKKAANEMKKSVGVESTPSKTAKSKIEEPKEKRLPIAPPRKPLPAAASTKLAPVTGRRNVENPESPQEKRTEGEVRFTPSVPPAWLDAMSAPPDRPKIAASEASACTKVTNNKRCPLEPKVQTPWGGRCTLHKDEQ